MTTTRARFAGAFWITAALLLATAGCGNSAGSAPAGVAETQETASTPQTPVGVMAIGHSGLTGENTDPNRPSQAALENSWATGTATPRAAPRSAASQPRRKSAADSRL